mgnify:CR=1 FL=1
MNEKMCPELLEHHMEFVDVMLEQLKELEVMISQATSKTDIRVAAHLMEMDRIKYVISDYLRCRLKKVCITTYFPYIYAATVYKFVCFATQ